MSDSINPENTLVLPISKWKLMRSLAGAALFLYASYYFFTDKGIQNHFNPLFIKAFGVACAPIGLGLVAFVIARLLSKEPGLVLDSVGLTDNSSGCPAGRISWHEIQSVTPVRAGRSAYISVVVSEPANYLRGNAWRRFLSRFMLKFYGTPIVLSQVWLPVDFEQFSNIITITTRFTTVPNNSFQPTVHSLRSRPSTKSRRWA